MTLPVRGSTRALGGLSVTRTAIEPRAARPLGRTSGSSPSSAAESSYESRSLPAWRRHALALASVVPYPCASALAGSAGGARRRSEAVVRSVADRAFLPTKSLLEEVGDMMILRQDDRLGPASPVSVRRRVRQPVSVRAEAVLVSAARDRARRLLLRLPRQWWPGRRWDGDREVDGAQHRARASHRDARHPAVLGCESTCPDWGLMTCRSSVRAARASFRARSRKLTRGRSRLRRFPGWRARARSATGRSSSAAGPW